MPKTLVFVNWAQWYIGGRKIKKKFKDILNCTVAFKASLGCMRPKNTTTKAKGRKSGRRKEKTRDQVVS